MTPRVIAYTVEPSDDGRLIKYFLRRRGYSTRQLNKLKYAVENGIVVDETPRLVTYALHTGETLTLTLPTDEKTALPNGLTVPVLYEDEDFLVLHKPAGMSVHPVKRHQDNTLAGAFATYLEKSGRVAAFRPVGRLDMNTSGLVVAALNAYMACNLVGAVRKIYLAVCEGILPEYGEINAPIAPCPDSRVKQQVTETGAPALTEYRRIAVAPAANLSLAAVRIHTGRTHQIRLHFAHIGHPLTGDSLYGKTSPHIGRQALHCAAICLDHPRIDKAIRLTDEIPADLLAMLPLFGQNVAQQIEEAYDAF